VPLDEFVPNLIVPTVTTQSSKLECLFSLKRGKRDVRASNFELSKKSPQVGLTVLLTLCFVSNFDEMPCKLRSIQNLLVHCIDICTLF